jgi:hypothetical protein
MALAKAILRSLAVNLLPVGVPLLFFVWHAARFRGWIIDDAGISFVYARSLAHGYGLVTQPGMPPVEGFSSPLWVLWLSPFFAIGAFDPNITPKMVSLALVAASFVFVRLILGLLSKGPKLGTFVVLSFLAFNPAFVIWTTSGLENPLNVLLVSILAYSMTRDTLAPRPNIRVTISISILAALCALTRPDGILYAAAYPLVLGIDVATRRRSIGEAAQTLLLYGAIFAVLFGGYKVFALLYFGDLLPNTYYAKGGQLTHSVVVWWLQVRSLLRAAGVNKYIAAASLLALIVFRLPRAALRPAFCVLILMLISVAIFVLLPRDWMPEYRFATAFFPPFYILGYLTCESILRRLPRAVPQGLLMGVLSLGVAASSARPFLERSDRFAKSPTVPFSSVAQLYAVAFNQYADALGVKDGSVLLPPVGGTLYYSELRVYDLAGLTDRFFARTLWSHSTAFYDRIFVVLKPTFIHVHGPWALAADLDLDPRFRQDYVPIHEERDPWAMSNMGLLLYSGNYVRKDALANPAALAELRAMPWTLAWPSR